MYPEKQIYDVAGFPAVSGRDLVARPRRAGRASATRRTCSARRPSSSTHRSTTAGCGVTTSTGTEVTCGAVVVTGGIGTFTPRPLPAGEEFLGRGLEYFVPEQPGVRRPGRRHRRRRRQRHRLGADARAARAPASPWCTAATQFRAHARQRRAGPRAPASRSSSTPRSTALDGGDRAGEGRDHRQGRGRPRVVAVPAGRRGARASPPTSARCASGASSCTTTGTSWSTRRCAPTCRASSPPATSPTTTARCG